MAAAPNARNRTTASGTATWRDVEPAAVVLIGGPEEYLGIRAMDRVRAQVRETSPDVEITRLNAGSYEAGSLTLHVSPSLFGENKLIEVEGLESMNDSFLADALTYVARPDDSVLRGAQGSLNTEPAGTFAISLREGSDILMS